MLRSKTAALARLATCLPQDASCACARTAAQLRRAHTATGCEEVALPTHAQPVKLVYATYGKPGRPCILHPTSFDAKNDGKGHRELEHQVGPGRTLDTDKYFVVIPNLLGAGLSTSPSTEPALRPFPRFTVADNVAAQHALLQRLGVEKLALVYGYSMGAMQALAWAARHPAMVPRAAAACGTAACQPYNAVFLESLLAVLGAEQLRPPPASDSSSRRAQQSRRLRLSRLRAFGRVYAGWGLPSEWYSRRLWAAHGYSSLEDFLVRSWEQWTVNAHPADLRAQLHTWRAAALAPRADDGELDLDGEAAALGRISARVLYLASAGDRYFPLAEAAAEAALVGRSGGGSARVVALSSEWGHRAGDPHRAGQEADAETIKREVQALLAEGAD